MSANVNNGRHGRHAAAGSYAQDQQAAREAYNAAANAYNAVNTPRNARPAQDYHYADYAYDDPYAAQYASPYPGRRSNQYPATAPANANWGSAAMVHQTKRKRIPGPLKFIIFLLLAIVLALGAYVLYLNHVISLGDKLDETREALSPSLPGQPFYMLVLGTDSRDATGQTAGLTDVIMLVRVDPINKIVTSVSIPRDTPWTDSQGNIRKINAAYMSEGPQGIINAVQNLTGVRVSHFAEVNFAGFETLVDSMGGLDVDVPITVGVRDAYTGEYVEVPEGPQHLNGQQAVTLCRCRNEYGDYPEASRQATVRMVTQAILSKITHLPLSSMPSAVTSAAQCVDTDMGVLELLGLAGGMRGGVTYYSATGPYEGGINPYCNDQWMCNLDPTGWSNLMAVVDSGGDPSTVSYEGDPLIVAGSPEDLAAAA